MRDMENINDNVKLFSEKFNFPLPMDTIYYYELEKISSFDEGIHRIYLFRIVNSVSVKSSAAYLCHIHKYTALWRKNNSVKTNYLIR